MQERVQCRTLECETMVDQTNRDNGGFCFSCCAQLRREVEQLLREVGHTLDLEAQFVVYCVERGLPHPHE